MENKMPLLGEKFPEMEVTTTFGKMKLPEDFKGKWFILFSHPGDFTPVCTTEFAGFAKRAEDFKNINVELIGLSVDQVFSHIKWVEWIKDNLNIEIPFPVIADELGRVSSQLGMLHPAKGTNTVRAVFIIDPDGIMRLMMYYPQEAGRSIDEIYRAVKALQVADKSKVAMPENWPNNSILGDKVIIPPAADYKTAQERRNDDTIEGYDWWFKVKKL
ncbi:peroxiredoxin [Oceanotoga sp. DSM 15011]|jgi:peroxiredoxin (alkyl hydroperoxide reductase subunit C)|uniref:Peroxiredoxin n=1 Tax=Oceanotoga teriensis TaxID=515440 RepID=A0AA45C4U7_9BACT|nr:MULTISPECIES: peroxiredoxin [Oceanotoga]MDN5342347.1 peroxiredoxin 2/4 [Oceanotoga sp.]MDO7976114.1 peroxiredoxin [Oceanotoga teriensis]PWJ87283.1 peroxiredoxin (alkyl hydroperoxide reductase subunit C) [Oceanotoga teriensis]UYP00950.1 peroxiredoxin [Oceanotoga sp. DSM 15011]